MDIFSMLQTAVIVDADTDEVIGQAVGFEMSHGRCRMRVVLCDDDEEDDPDDGEREDIPVPTINEKIRAISGGKK